MEVTVERTEACKARISFSVEPDEFEREVQVLLRQLGTRTRLRHALEGARLKHPEATILLIEPDETDPDMLLANPMNFAARQRILRYGYDSAARLLVERHEQFAAACAQHSIKTNPGKLGSRPWESLGT